MLKYMTNRVQGPTWLAGVLSCGVATIVLVACGKDDDCRLTHTCSAVTAVDEGSDEGQSGGGDDDDSDDTSTAGSEPGGDSREPNEIPSSSGETEDDGTSSPDATATDDDATDPGADCEGGEIRCANASTPEVCNADGEWETQDACTGEEPRCLAGEGCACTEGTTRCADESTEETCNASGGWEATSCSSAAPVCDTAAGRCVLGPSVKCGEIRCANATTPEVCNADGAWEAQAVCTGDEPRCLDGEGCACNEGVTRCADDRTLERCDDSGAWVPNECPLATPVCDAAAGSCVLGPSVKCGNIDCPVSDGGQCCREDGVFTCQAAGGTCNSPRNSIACDAASDCASDELCCYRVGPNAPSIYCTRSCAPGTYPNGLEFQVCDPTQVAPSECREGACTEDLSLVSITGCTH